MMGIASLSAIAARLNPAAVDLQRRQRLGSPVVLDHESRTLLPPVAHDGRGRIRPAALGRSSMVV
jgi:hypothetical protein